MPTFSIENHDYRRGSKTDWKDGRYCLLEMESIQSSGDTNFLHRVIRFSMRGSKNEWEDERRRLSLAVMPAFSATESHAFFETEIEDWFADFLGAHLENKVQWTGEFVATKFKCTLLE